MINISIGITDDGVKKYPPHKHPHYEIMTYLSGTGYLYTPEKNYDFEPGTVILVPPESVHGSVSEAGFKNISIGGAFENLISAKTVVVIRDSSESDITALAKIIYNNRYKSNELLHSLCTAFIQLVTQDIALDGEMCAAVHEVVRKIYDKAFEPQLNLCGILNQSGYSEDYIRSKFRQLTGMTPTAFLTEIRMRRAKFLIDVYGGSLSLQDVAFRCGFCDYVYFSKQFKKFFGCSPREYRESTTY